MPEYDVKYIAGNFHRLKTLRDISMEALAHATNVSYQTLVNISGGKNTNPSVKTLLKIANFFNIPIQKLLEQTD